MSGAKPETPRKRLLFIARRIDDHARRLLQELPKRGFAVQLLGPEESGAGQGTALPSLFAQAAPRAEVVYLLLQPGDADFPALAWDYAPHAGKVVADLARLSLNRLEPGVADFLARLRPWAVVRDLRQLRGPAGQALALESLLAPDYLAYSYLPRTLLADLGWFLRKAAGERVPEQPPSAQAAYLLTAPGDDPQAQRLAAELLSQEPEYPPAVMRRSLAAARDQGALPAQLAPRQNADPLQFMSLLALEQHLQPASGNAGALAGLARHVWGPGPRAGSGQGKRILLFVVYKQRDLFVDLILRHHLERLGHQVVMRSLGEDPMGSILELLPEVIIWGAKTTPYQVQLARFARDHNIVSIVRREEAGTARRRWDQLSPTVRNWSLGNLDYSPLVDLELVFGEDFAEILRQEGRLPPARCHAVGAMTFDPYFLPDFARFMPSREDFCRRLGLDPRKRIMLLLTPWTYADRDPRKAIPEAGGGSQDAQATAEIQRTMALHRDGRQGWLEFLETLHHDKGGQWNLILKVHPGERSEAYREFFRTRGLDVKLTVSGYVVEMLNYTDLLVHAGSTVAIEAHLLGKPSLAYWVKAPENSPIYQLVPYANTYQEFEHLFHGLDLARGNADEAVIKGLEKELYGRMDGAACRRGAEIIHAFIKDLEVRPFRYPGEAAARESPRSADPYGTNITQEEIDFYYPMVQRCLAAGGQERQTPGQAFAPRPSDEDAQSSATGRSAGRRETALPAIPTSHG